MKQNCAGDRGGCLNFEVLVVMLCCLPSVNGSAEPSAGQRSPPSLPIQCVHSLVLALVTWAVQEKGSVACKSRRESREEWVVGGEAGITPTPPSLPPSLPRSLFFCALDVRLVLIRTHPQPRLQMCLATSKPYALCWLLLFTSRTHRSLSPSSSTTPRHPSSQAS